MSMYYTPVLELEVELDSEVVAQYRHTCAFWLLNVFSCAEKLRMVGLLYLIEKTISIKREKQFPVRYYSAGFVSCLEFALGNNCGICYEEEEWMEDNGYQGIVRRGMSKCKLTHVFIN